MIQFSFYFVVKELKMYRHYAELKNQSCQEIWWSKLMWGDRVYSNQAGIL